MSRTFQQAVAVSLAAHLILWIGLLWLGNGPGQIQSDWAIVPPVEMVAVQEDFIPAQPAPPVLTRPVEAPVPKHEREPVESATAPGTAFTPPRSPPVLTPVNREQSAPKPPAATIPVTPRPLPEPGQIASPGPAPSPAPLPETSGNGRAGPGAEPSVASNPATNVARVRPGATEPARLPGPVRYRQAREPEYPATARRRRQEGVVLIEALLAPDGRVRSVQLQRSSGFPLLDQAALKAVAGWEFVVPADESWRVEVPVRFQLTR